nr:hypothetical protein [Tanacetum cinerariifolium]
FADLPTEEEILDFLRFLGHSHDIRYLTDVNVNKLYQPWRSFTSVINKCLTDFVYQVEHKSQKRSNEMNYPRFTKVIIDYFMTRKPSILRRNRINWHYVQDDALFSTINVVSRHQTTQQYGVILPIELTTAEIKNSKAYKEYHACAMGEAAPKPKASATKKKGDSASSTTPPTPTPKTTVESAPRLSATAKGKQPSRATTTVEPTDSGSGTDEGTSAKPGVSDVPSDDLEEELSWKSSDDEDVGSHEEGKKSDESDDDRDEGSDNDSDETVKSGAGKDDDDDDDEDDDDNDEEEELSKDDEEDKETGKCGDEVRESKGPRKPEESEEESNDEEEQELRLSEEARIQEDEDADELYRDVNINQG